MAEWARKFKKAQAKKTLEIKEINFMKLFFDQNPFCAISKMAKNQFLNWKNVKISRKKNDLFNFTSFFPWTFLTFLAHSDVKD